MHEWWLASGQGLRDFISLTHRLLWLVIEMIELNFLLRVLWCILHKSFGYSLVDHNLALRILAHQMWHLFAHFSLLCLHDFSLKHIGQLFLTHNIATSNMRLRRLMMYHRLKFSWQFYLYLVCLTDNLMSKLLSWVAASSHSSCSALSFKVFPDNLHYFLLPP